MNTTRRFVPYLAALALAALSISPAHSQSVIIPPTVQGVSGMITADDTDVALLCKFVGPSTGTTTTMNSGKIEVTVTTSDITFTSGAQGSEAADTSLECPVSGALGGIIDVSNAACNTVGEVLDIVNAPTSNFRCVALDSLRSDIVDGRLLTLAATRATTNTGLAINWDTSTAFMQSVALVPSEYRSIAAYVKPGSRQINHDVFQNTRTVVLKANATSTYGSGTSFLQIWSVDVNNLSSNKSGETATQMFNEAGGSTTANKIFDLGAPVGIIGRNNEKVLVRLNNSAAAASAVTKANGYTQRLGPVTNQ